MSKITFVKQLLFGSSGSSSAFGQPGSINTTKTNTKDPSTIQALSAFLDGLTSIVKSGTYKIALEDFNSLLLLAFYQIAYIQQSGICEWSTDMVYYTGSLVNVSGNIYQSLTDDNTGNNPATDSVNWMLISGTPVGVMQEFAGPVANIPSGFLLCDGSAVSRTTYANLFSKIGTTWGAGDGSTTFNLPPKGIFAVGYSSGDSDFGTVGNTGGEKTHLLTAAESGVPAHTHVEKCLEGGAVIGYGVQGNSGSGNTEHTGYVSTYPNTASPASSAHNNLPPYGVVAKIIKY